MHIPSLCYHRGQRRYYVTLAGSEVYLSGPLPKRTTPPTAVQRAYDEAIAAYLAERSKPAVVPGPDPSLSEVALAFLVYAEQYYRRQDGTTYGEYYAVAAAVKAASRMFGATKAKDFTLLKLAAVRDALVKPGGSRRYANMQASRIRRMFRWAANHELVPAGMWQALRALDPIKRGKQGLREESRKGAVNRRDFLDGIRRLSPQLRLMARVHRLIGCRSEEICLLRPVDVVRQPDKKSPTGEMWTYKPAVSKTGETYFVGPRAQTILKWVFARMTPGQEYAFPPRRHNGGKHYRASTYRKLLARACARAGVVVWTPISIRKAAGEEARKKHFRGIEATQARLRHREITVSQKYAEDRDDLGAEVARRFG